MARARVCHLMPTPRLRALHRQGQQALHCRIRYPSESLLTCTAAATPHDAAPKSPLGAAAHPANQRKSRLESMGQPPGSSPTGRKCLPLQPAGARCMDIWTPAAKCPGDSGCAPLYGQRSRCEYSISQSALGRAPPLGGPTTVGVSGRHPHTNHHSAFVVAVGPAKRRPGGSPVRFRKGR